jgi:hypothetical protein
LSRVTKGFVISNPYLLKRVRGKASVLRTHRAAECSGGSRTLRGRGGDAL